MLTREVMGLLGLGILWVNTLLVVGAALAPLRQLLERLARMRRLGLRRGVVGGSDHVLAAHEVKQVGRRAADDAARPAILFHDQAYRSLLYGGTVEVDGDTLAIDEGQPVEVWVPAQTQRAVAACPGQAEFESAYADSKKAKGFVREVRSELRSGDTAYLVGVRDGDAIRAPEGAELLIASFDPRPWLRRRVALVTLFQLGMLAGSVVITGLCLYPPVFGTVSTIGGVLGLVFFLLVLQPVGVSVREAVLLPSQAILRGSWVSTAS